MLKLLIVEDERVLREGIVHLLNWEIYNIGVCLTADDGAEGLELILQENPDIVITDIRMPKMDGLTMVKMAQDHGMEFETIVLSGYSDFVYARTGMSLGISDYVLKPCLPEDMASAVLKVAQKIEVKSSGAAHMEKLQTDLNRNLLFAIEQTLSQWCLYSGKPLENRRQSITDLQMKLDYEYVHIGILMLELHSSDKKLSAGEAELMLYAAGNIVKETLTPVYEGKLETFRDEQAIVWVGNFGANIHQTDIDRALKVAQSNLSMYLKLSSSIGVGQVTPTIETLQASRDQAIKALEARYFHGLGGVFWFNTLQAAKDGVYTIWNDELTARLESEITQALKTSQYAAAIDGVEQWLEQIGGAIAGSPNEVNLKATAFIVALKNITQQMTVTSFPWKDTMIDWSEHLPQIQTFDELSAIIKKIVQNIVEALKSETVLHRTVQSALIIIHAKYAHNLTLDQVARETFVSNSYLSTLFKQELGVNFLDYLHQYRIEQSKQLLRKNYKVYAVANEVGYSDEKHFSTTFKKWTGLTPMQYRKQPN